MKNNFFYKSNFQIFIKDLLNSEVSSQILYGEKFKILSKNKNWIKIKHYLIIILAILKMKII